MAYSPELAERLHRLADTSIKLARADGPKAACRKGCSYCCYLPVRCLESEAVLATQYLHAKMGAEGFVEIRDKVRQYRLRAAEQVEDSTFQLACPFLNSANECSIYPVRPLACRGYVSFDAEACRVRHETCDPNYCLPLGGVEAEIAYSLLNETNEELVDFVSAVEKLLHRQ